VNLRLKDMQVALIGLQAMLTDLILAGNVIFFFVLVKRLLTDLSKKYTVRINPSTRSNHFNKIMKMHKSLFILELKILIQEPLRKISWIFIIDTQKVKGGILEEFSKMFAIFNIIFNKRNATIYRKNAAIVT